MPKMLRRSAGKANIEKSLKILNAKRFGENLELFQGLYRIFSIVKRCKLTLKIKHLMVIYIFFAAIVYLTKPTKELLQNCSNYHEFFKE